MFLPAPHIPAQYIFYRFETNDLSQRILLFHKPLIGFFQGSFNTGKFCEAITCMSFQGSLLLQQMFYDPLFLHHGFAGLNRLLIKQPEMVLCLRG